MLKRATKLAAWLYLVALFLLIAAWWAVGERYWFLVLPRYAPAVLYLLPLVPVSLLALWTRTRPHPGYLVPLIAVMIYLLGFQIPNLQAVGEPNLEVMTLNVKAGLMGAKEIGDFLGAADCDLVGMQEARVPLVAKLPDPVPIIAETVQGYHLARGGIRHELVILSRFPILERKQHSLEGLSQALEARVDVNGQPVRVLNVHMMTGDPKKILGKNAGLQERLALTAQTRHQQTKALLELIEDSPDPVILLGDFNTPPNSEDYGRLAGALQDSFGAKGLGFGYTYRADWPVWRIDYIWHSQQLKTVDSKVSPVIVSDHRALISSLRL